MNSEIDPENLPWGEPRLYKPKDNDLSKPWSVNYWLWHFDENRLVRKRVMLADPTISERLARAEAVIAELWQTAGKAYLGTKPAHLRRDNYEKTPVEVVVSPSLLVSTAVQMYIDFSRKALAYNTFKSYRTAVLALQRYLERHRRGKTTLGNFEPADAAEFLNELVIVEGLSNRTRNNIKGAATTFFNHFIKLDKSKKLKKSGNPFEDPDIGVLPQVQNKHQSYSLSQQAQYREICQEPELQYLFTFCRWMYYTLMRPHEELRRLRVRDVRIRSIYVTGETAKTNQGEYVEIPLPLEQLIQQAKIRDYPGHYFVFSAAGEPGPEMVGPKFFYRRHVKVMEKMNLLRSGHDMYSWKHTGAIALWTATKDIELVRQQARHKTIKQTIEYLRDLGVRLADDDKIHKFPVL
ncbi:hypothetical protein [Spirosoma koreense]